MLGKIFGKDSALVHLLVLSAGVAAVFLAAKFAANHLPSNGFGGGLRKITNSI